MLKIILNRLQPQAEEITASRFQSRKEHHRTNIQSQDLLREIPAASAESTMSSQTSRRPLTGYGTKPYGQLWGNTTALMRTLILFTFPYAYKSWTVTAELERRIQALEMRCYRKLLNISYKDHVTNEEVRSRIQHVIGPGVHDDLLTMVKKRKIRWYGHISRSSSMAKTILQGAVKGARRRRRQKKTWEDNNEWTGMEFGDSLRAAEDRERWKGIVATSSVVPPR